MNNQVAIDCERCRKKPSGLQQYCEILVDGLSQLRDDCVVYGPYEIGGFPLKRYHRLHKLYNPSLQGYPLVHITHQASAISRFRKKGKMLLTVHDLNYLHLDHTKKHRRDAFIRTVRRNIELADQIVCISHFTKVDLLAHRALFPAVDDKPIEVVYNGLVYPQEGQDFSVFLPAELQGKRYLLNIGQAMAKKNQSAIVEMMPYIDVEVVLVVSSLTNSYIQSIRERAKALEVEGRLHLYTHVSDEVKQALLQHAEAMVHPSLAEGFGFTPVEQMYYGKPVFLSNLCSLPEVGGDVAVFFDPLEPPEALAEIIKGGMEHFFSDHERQSERLRNRAHLFSQEVMARNYSNIYDNLL